MASILVVEDTPATLALAVKLLQAAGHDVVSATHAREGLALAEELLPDLVLMDLGLPDMDGTRAMRALRTTPRTAALRIVAFTAYAMPSDHASALANGFDGYVSKPLDFATFPTQISELLP